MTNLIWTLLIIIGVLIACCTGKINMLGNIILSSSGESFSIFFKLSLMILFWNGIFNILKDSGFLTKMSKGLSKILKFIFPEIGLESKAMEYISITLLSNLLGLGVASTSTGLKAFSYLKEEAKDKKLPSKSMITFIILNISSITFFPTTIISLRSSYKGTNDFKLLLIIWLTTLFGTIVGQLLTILFTRGKK